MAKVLKGIKLVHVNSTKYGGGVAEILTTLTLLTQELGIDTRWEVISGSPAFFDCTKQFHNAIQGHKQTIPQPKLFEVYKQTNKENAENLKGVLESADVVFVHDPQPAALISSFPNRKNKWVWRCHIDASRPHRVFWGFLREFCPTL